MRRRHKVIKVRWWSIMTPVLCDVSLVVTDDVVPFSPHWTGRRTVELHDASRFWLSAQLRFRGYQSMPTLNHHLYKGKLPQTDRWRKPVLTRVGHYTTIYLQPTTTTPAIQKAFVAWVGTNWHQQSVERILEVGLGGQCPPRGRPHSPTSGFCSPSTTVVSPELLPHCTRSPFRTGQGHCGACRKKWNLTDSDQCSCRETQTMSHIVKSCPLTRLHGGLSKLRSAADDTVAWLTSYGS